MRRSNRLSALCAVVVLFLATVFIFPAQGQSLKEGMEQASVAHQAYDLRLMGKTDEARQLLEEALAADPENAVAYFEFARTQLYLLDIEGMQRSILHAARLDPGNARYHYFAGISSLFSIINAAHEKNEGAFEGFALKAIEELETAVELDPEYDEARCVLAGISSNDEPYMGGDPARAEKHIEILEERDPIWGAMARSATLSGAGKRELWEGILAEYPDDGRAHYEAGKIFIEIQDLDRAAECADRAIELDPENRRILLNLGTMLGMKERWEKAESVINRYLEDDSIPALEAYAIATLAVIKKRTGAQQQAEKLLERAKAIDPHVWITVMPPPEEIFTPL